MNKYLTVMLLAGFAVLGACASDDAVVKDSDADEGAVAEQPAAMPQSDKMKSSAQDSASMTDDSEEMPLDKESSATTDTDEEMTETGTASTGAGNLVSTCTYGADTRVISVIYDNEKTDTVCEVTYEKSTGVQTLWSANNERDYCLPKAKEFIGKQRGWGWECTDLE